MEKKRKKNGQFKNHENDSEYLMCHRNLTKNTQTHIYRICTTNDNNLIRYGSKWETASNPDPLTGRAKQQTYQCDKYKRTKIVKSARTCTHTHSTQRSVYSSLILILLLLDGAKSNCCCFPCSNTHFYLDFSINKVNINR